MAPPRTGHVKWHPPKPGEKQGRYRARIRLPNGKRAVCVFEPGPHSPEGLARAKEAAAATIEDLWASAGIEGGLIARKPKAAPVVAGETVEQWAMRWFADRAARGIQTKVDHGRLRAHAFPLLRGKAIADVTRSDLEGIVEALDAKIASGATKWKTTHNAWGVVSKMFDDAANAKTRSLRVRADNPAAGVRGPDRGARTLKQYLYPSELLAVVSHEDTPRSWARIIALGVYLQVRLGELEALEFDDVDLDRGTVLVHRAINREDGTAKATKTDSPRRFQIEPALLPLLRAMHAEAGGQGRVIGLPSDTNHARALRTHLWNAGARRVELHQPSRTRKMVTAYDLRATGITWRAIRGDDPLKIMAGAGHRSFATTQGYIREAEPMREGFGEVFPALPERLLEGPKTGADWPPIGHKGANLAESLCRRRGSNPVRSHNSAEMQPKTHDRVSADDASCAAKCADAGGEANRLATLVEAHVAPPPLAPAVVAPNHRAALVAALGDAVKAAALAGDLEAVRIAADALTRLVGLGTGDGAEVVDLAGERAKRYGSDD